MFPLRDRIRPQSFPAINYALIAVNVLIFLYESSLSPLQLDAFLHNFGLVPAELSLLRPLSLLPLVSSMFLHGSWIHLITNMWTLFIFGDNVEDRLGSVSYLGFYLFSGVVASLTHAFLTNSIYSPTVGASGAIAAVLGAYFLLYPRARILTFIPIFIIPWLIEIPAFIYLGLWFFSQLSQGFLSLSRLGGAAGFSSIAWWAHIGGFVIGWLLARRYAHPRRPEPEVVILPPKDPYGRW
jgi:membrane associated rhomboid family serine protease